MQQFIMPDLKYFLRRKHYVSSTIFLILFSVLFLELYNPFSSTVWLSLTRGRFLMTLLFYVVCVVIVAASWVVIARRTRTKDITLRFMGGVIAVQYFLITITYLLFSIQYMHLTVMLFLKVLFCVAMVLSIPYTLYFRHASFKAKAEENNLLRKRI